MAIEVPNTDPILDPAWARAALTGTFGEALSVFNRVSSVRRSTFEEISHHRPG